jgi:TonB family protein
LSRFVKGHDFSRADKVVESSGLQPPAIPEMPQINFSAASFAPSLVRRILARMKPIIRSLISYSVLMFAAAHGYGQSSPLKIVKLVPPIYPPIARAARVSGEVHLQITIQEDGKARDVQVKSGPEMLKKSAVESARQSLFEPAQQGTESPYELIYRFNLDPGDCSEEKDPSYPRVSDNLNAVTITDKSPMLCDPTATATYIKVRSVKCLYLWRCAWRVP